ncbi:MAG: glycosyltransferase family 1 protein [Alkalibacterium sp.]|nr:glycosyltransferase family 1 protein [Alkalibacterium sp.]
MVNHKTEFPVRIAHVLGKMNGAGVEATVMNYYRHIDKTKIQFDFIVDNDSTLIPYDEIQALGGRVYIVPPYQQLFKYNQELIAIFKNNNYKIVHSHINALSVFPMKAAKKAGVPIRIAHSHSTSAPGEIKKNIVKNILRPFSRAYPTHYCSCSKGAGEWLFGKNIRHIKHLNVVNNGIEINKFLFDKHEREILRNELGLTDKFVIGHTGRLCFQKNQEFLINLLSGILNDIPNAVLLLIGNGQEQERLIKLAVALDVSEHIIFLGNKTDVHRYYNAMDVFAFPSRYEGFGVSAIEAQASGMPVILSNNVPVEACLTERCVVLSIDKGVTPWIDSIVQLKENVDRTFDMNFQDYDISVNAEALNEYYFRISRESVIII